ncbi:mevalonate kinase [Nocardia sp. NPDC003482]
MTTREVGIGRAHAKSILFGEHAVVYGAPAIAIPIPQLSVMVQARHSTSSTTCIRLTNTASGNSDHTVVERSGRPEASDSRLNGLAESFFLATETPRSDVDVTVDCGIPLGRGLGSSAACARAVVLALSDLFDRPIDTRLAFDLVQTAERVAHGSPSGVDTVATGSPVPIWFQSGTAKELSVGSDGVLVIADTGIFGSTKDAFEVSRDLFESDPASKTRFLRHSTRLTTAAVEDLAEGQINELGQRMSENHELLRGLGVSTVEIDRLVHAALRAGCLGAKLSGGGLGGCVIAVVDGRQPVEAVTSALRSAGAKATWEIALGSRAN